VVEGARLDFGDDRVLVDALRRRDEAAFGWLLDTYDASLRRVAIGFVRTPASADEVVQETWLAVITGIDRFELRSTVKTWLFRILMNQARTRGTRESRYDVVADVDEDVPSFDPSRFRRGPGPTKGHWRKGAGPAPWEDQPAERLASAESVAVVAAAISRLPARQRTVISLRDVDGWTAAEVCDLLDLSEANQRVLLHRARARVRQALEDVHLAVGR
jgi:RNA polymerase sigma-70 factor (ECF subfamily)